MNLDFLLIPAVIGIITFGIYKLFELFVHRRERLNVIEKLSDKQFVGAANGFSLPDYSRSSISYGALKGGCLLLGVGLGLLIGFVIGSTSLPNNFEPDVQYRDTISIIYGACELLFGGIGLLTAFFIEQKIGKKKE